MPRRDVVDYELVVGVRVLLLEADALDLVEFLEGLHKDLPVLGLVLKSVPKV